MVRRFDWGEQKQRTRETAPLLRCIVGHPLRLVEFDRMPILADALEEAGGDHADILNHCRGAGPRARGCWVIDHILGRE